MKSPVHIMHRSMCNRLVLCATLLAASARGQSVPRFEGQPLTQSITSGMVIPHVLAGREWVTEITITNNTSFQAQLSPLFIMSGGVVAKPHFRVTGHNGGTGTYVVDANDPYPQATKSISIAPKGVARIETLPSKEFVGAVWFYQGGATNEKLLQVTYSFRNTLNEAGTIVALQPFTTGVGFPFRCDNGFDTGVAMYNPNSHPVQARLEVYRQRGEVMTTHYLTLSAFEHRSAVLTSLIGSARGEVGRIEVTAVNTQNGQLKFIPTVALRFASNGTFTGIPTHPLP